MPFPVDAALIEAAETQLGRRFPQGLRDRMLRNNGGEVLVRYEDEEPDEDEDVWFLHPVWDPTDKRRMKRTMSHIVKETQQARQWIGFPEDAIAIAEDGTGDRLILRNGSDDVEVWDHETGETEPVVVDWNFDL